MRTENVWLAAVALVVAPGSAVAYIDRPLTLGRAIQYDATNIVVAQVDKVSLEKGIIIYKKMVDLKGKSAEQMIRQRVNHHPGDAPRPVDRNGPRVPILGWAKPGRVAILFYHTNDKATLTCTGQSWYTGYRGDEGWWRVSEFNERALAWAYLGSVNKLQEHIKAILEGKEVVVTAARYDSYGGGSGELWNNRTANRNLALEKKVRIWRIRASQKIVSLADALADRSHFVVGLGTGDREAVPGFVEALKSKDVSVRRRAADDLGQVGPEGKAALPALIQALQDKDEQVRVNAAEALWEMDRNAGKVVPTLVETLKGKEESVRRAAVVVLCRMGPAAKLAVPALAAALQDRDREVRQTAARALWRIGPDAGSAAPALVVSLRDEDANVRRNAAGALGTLGAQGKACVAALSEALKDKDAEVRHFAARALVRLGDRKAKRAAAPVFLELLRVGDPDPRVRAEMIVFLWRIGSEPESQPWGLDRGDLVAATQLLTGIYSTKEDKETQKNAVPSLVAAFKRASSPGHRVLFAQTLGTIGAEAKAAIPALREGLKDKDGSVRDASADALRKIKS